MQINLIRLRKEHLEEIMFWRQMPDITKWMYTDPRLSMEKQLNWYDRISASDNCIYWVIKVDNTDAGLIAISNIDEKNKSCSWIYYIGNENCRGKGLGKILEYNICDYVFDKINLNKLYCEVLEENEKVIQLHKKCGQKIEGVLKEHIYKYGSFHDLILMAINKKEWDTLKPSLNFPKVNIE